jgi:hypothetical protein
MMKEKSEIRISKFETNSKSKFLKFQTKAIQNSKSQKKHPTAESCLFLFWSFEFWSFGFVSDFGFRASNFTSVRVRLWPIFSLWEKSPACGIIFL